MSRMCTLCYRLLPLTAFGGHKNGRDGLRSRCKECNRIEARQSYRRNPEPTRQRAARARKGSLARIREWLRAIKVKYGCVCCGEHELCVLDFHHMDASNKDRAVTSAMNKGFLFVARELAKCVVVCANCHRRIHAGLIILPPSTKTVRETPPRSPNARVKYTMPRVLRRAIAPTD